MYAEKLILETDEHGFFKQKLNLRRFEDVLKQLTH